jgi:hypothetical protein
MILKLSPKRGDFENSIQHTYWPNNIPSIAATDAYGIIVNSLIEQSLRLNWAFKTTFSKNILKNFSIFQAN